MQNTTPPAARSGAARLLISLSMLYVLALGLYLLLHAAGLNPEEHWLLGLLHNGAPKAFVPLLVILPLGILLRSGQLVGLTLVLLTVGAAWIGPRFFPRPAPPFAAQSYSLITLNVYPYNPRLEDVAQWLLAQSADLVFLQEVPPDALEAALAPVAAAYPYRIDEFAAAGDLLFSRFPLRDATGLLLEDQPQVRAIAEIDGREVALYSVHLLMPLREKPHIALPLLPDLLLRYDESARNRQIRQLIAHLEEEPLPFIAAGDFNMADTSPIYAELAARWVDAYATVQAGLGPTWPGGASEELPDVLPPLVRLDYVWLGDALEPLQAEVGPHLGSDHLPVLITFRFRPA